MELLLKRIERTEESTIGELSINGVFECWILEDKDRRLTNEMTVESIQSIKVYGKTCIPAGRYEIAITFSNRFQKYLPLLMNVKGFEGIRIHPGNAPTDTLGCLLPGTEKTTDKVLNSRSAFKQIFSKMKAVEKKEKIFITIE